MIAGLILIAPLLAFDLWIIWTVTKEIISGQLERKRIPFFITCVLIGIVIGVWLAFSLTYKPNVNFQISGFPVPTNIGRFEQKAWSYNSPPELIRVLGLVTNLLFGVAFALLPLKLFSAARKLKKELSR